MRPANARSVDSAGAFSLSRATAEPQRGELPSSLPHLAPPIPARNHLPTEKPMRRGFLGRRVVSRTNSVPARSSSGRGCHALDSPTRYRRRVSTRPFRVRQAGAILSGLCIALSVVGCSSTVSLKAATDANHPTCAEVTVRLPASVQGQGRRWTDAQSTGAWGDPVSIVLTCGVAAPGPSALPCYELGGVDWLALDQEENVQRAITYGRTPAVLVSVTRESGLDFASVLEELGDVTRTAIPQRLSRCL